jgi:hypothetical protein
MNIKAIIAMKDYVVFELCEELQSGNTRIIIREYNPMRIGEYIYEEIAVPIENNKARISISRFCNQRDRSLSWFELENNGNILEGDRYVTDFTDTAQWSYIYPQPDTIKALAAEGEDLKELGIKQSLVNINLPALMTLNTEKAVIPFESEGRIYYFNKDRVSKLDEFMQNTYRYGICVTAILLNAPKLFDSGNEEALLKQVIHPAYDWASKSTYISAFPMTTPEGQGFYKAFVSFLVQRYAREDAKYGRMCGMIISNEINSQYIWGNAGEMEVSNYTREYTTALRLAWLCTHKYYKNFRVYVSLDHFWNLTFDPRYPKRYYKGRDVIDYINRYSKEEGDFDWNVAYHPYPENLMYPDFYNDRSASFDFSTQRITFKNIEMLPAYLSGKEYLCRNHPRRIILSEQGFNSKGDTYSEKQGAAAYCLAYQKAKRIPTIDLMTHHAYLDNPYEFGLNLGIRKRNADGTPGEAKLIYYMMKDMDTEKEQERIDWARSFIGEELYDSLRMPAITYGEADKSKESEFQESNG